MTPCFQHDGYRSDCADCRDMSGKAFADVAMAATGRGPLTNAEIRKGWDLAQSRDMSVEVVGRYVDGVLHINSVGPPIPVREPRAFPRFNRYSIPHRPRPGEVECPYCVKRPVGAKGLRDHCRAVHPDKPEAKI